MHSYYCYSMPRAFMLSKTVLQEDISAIASFLNYKHLNFNEDKCRMMLLSRKRSNSLSPPRLYLNSTELVQVESYKYLGVILTNTLSWRPHITALCKKARKLIGMMYRSLYKHCNQNTLLKLYLTTIRPHLVITMLYCAGTFRLQIGTCIATLN